MAKLIIGRKDIVDFPDLDLWNIEAKIDTGAYSSSIHCHNILMFRDSGVDMVRFNLLDPSHEEYNGREFTLPVHKIKTVKSSMGESSVRFFIKTSIILYGRKIPIELSLTDRSEMRTPVLLGRKLLKKGFLVDCTKVNLSFKEKTRK